MIIFQKFFQEYNQSFQQFESRSGATLSVLIWVQAVCKGYQQMANVAASKERVLERFQTDGPKE